MTFISNQTQNTSLKVLIVEDDKSLQTAIRESLELERVDVICANCAEEALVKLKSESVHMVISDINMPNMSGEELLVQIRQEYPYLPVMLMTAYSSVDRAVKAIQRGAVDYLAKPFSLSQLTAKVKQYTQTLAEDYQADQPVMVSNESKAVFAMAAKVAQSNANVLISGESGTGKEVLARYIHDSSPRHSRNFVAINCAAIPENMLEAILFGHEKGSFTGAHKAMPGKFELADGGTLLIDEINEIPLSLQAKILRALQEKEVERIGSKEPIAIDVRVVATTNRNIAEEVAAKNFREDLYYRINVFPLQWKPLRERRDDIIPLAETFLNRHVSSKTVRPILTQEAKDKLMSYNWPGNVRELDNVMQRALVLVQNDQITATDLLIDMTDSGIKNASTYIEVTDADQSKCKALEIKEEKSLSGKTLTTAGQSNKDSLQDQSHNFDTLDAQQVLFAGDMQGEDLRTKELRTIVECLQKNNGSRKKTAEMLGISPRTLRYKIAKIKEYWPALGEI